MSVCDPCIKGTHDHEARNVDQPGLFIGRLSHNDWCDCEEQDNVNDTDYTSVNTIVDQADSLRKREKEGG